MKRTGTATLPLHGGKAPHWLFKRMQALAGAIISAIVVEFGTAALLKKLSDPFWFQCLGCVLGFDWHSSGLTTTVTGAIKEGIKGQEKELGFFVAGGKGKRSRKTPEELLLIGQRYGINTEPLIYASRLSAKVDNSAVQDGYQLYHHTFFLDIEGRWAVVQQGMSETTATARRYHWLSEKLETFTKEPHSAVCSETTTETLNLVHRDSLNAQKVITELSARRPEENLKDLSLILDSSGLFGSLHMPRRHFQRPDDIKPDRLKKIFLKTYEKQVADFEQLIGTEGVGAKTLRALSLISELIYDTPVSYQDPARFSYAVGGKDGIPYPVDRQTYDKTIEVMKKAIERARIGQKDRINAIRRLITFTRGQGG